MLHQGIGGVDPGGTRADDGNPQRTGVFAHRERFSSVSVECVSLLR